MTPEPTDLKPDDICRTPFEPSGLVRIVGYAGKCLMSGYEIVDVEFIEDHPHGYRVGELGAYFVHELKRIDDA